MPQTCGLAKEHIYPRMPRSLASRKKSQRKPLSQRRVSTRQAAITQDVGFAGRNVLAPRIAKALKPVGVPVQSRTTHRYVQAGVIVSSTGSLGIQQFRANSLFDPDLTGTGHQPYGFDQFKAYYATYMVTSSKISLECIAITSPTLAGVMTSSESSTGFTDAIFYGEPGRGQSGIVSPVFGNTRNFEARWSLADIPNHDPSEYSALVGASPANSDFFTVFTQDSFTLAATPTLYWAVCIEYQVTWKDPITVASS